MPLTKLLLQEWELFRDRRRIKIGACMLIACIPFLYAYTFLSSIWDPFSNLKNLPVAYVNLDEGLEFRAKNIHLADDVVKEMLRRGDFRYIPFANEESARAVVSQGGAYFAVIFPKDFSRKALPGFHAEPGVVKLVVSEGLGFTAALIGRRMGNELSNKLNSQLNARRWEIVFETSGEAGENLKQLRDGMEKLRVGSKLLLAGEEKMAPHLAELGAGLEKLGAGSMKLRDGAATLKKEGGRIPLFGGKVASGAERLEAGAGLLSEGIDRAASGVKQLSAGQNQLRDGAQAIASGVDLITSRIPQKIAAIPGDAIGLAASVRVEQESLAAPGTTYGDAFAPYFIALSLWLGIVVCTFFFHFRRLREAMQAEPRWKRMAQKLFLPGIIAIAQAIILAFGTKWLLGLHTPNFALYLFVCLQASLEFLLIIFSFILIFRDAGRLVALLFFVFQLAAAGGAFPIEMSGGFFERANPYLPMANIVKALRAVNLGAYDGQALAFLLKSWAAAILIFAIAALLARWKYVRDEEYSLAADI